jgi:hypothetical protein
LKANITRAVTKTLFASQHKQNNPSGPAAIAKRHARGNVFGGMTLPASSVRPCC